MKTIQQLYAEKQAEDRSAVEQAGRVAGAIPGSIAGGAIGLGAGTGVARTGAILAGRTRFNRNPKLALLGILGTTLGAGAAGAYGGAKGGAGAYSLLHRLINGPKESS